MLFESDENLLRYFRFWENEYIGRNEQFKKELSFHLEKLKNYTDKLNNGRQIYKNYLDMLRCSPWDEWYGDITPPEPLHNWRLFVINIYLTLNMIKIG